METVIDARVSMRGNSTAHQAEFKISTGEIVMIELGRVYLVKDVFSAEDSVFPHGTAFALTKVVPNLTNDDSIIDTERIAVGGGFIETGWLKASTITSVTPA